MSAKLGLISVCFLLALLQQEQHVGAQDILRRNNNQPQQHQQQYQASNPLDNIQLPPQLASLTPQQLHQLAQLRELQLQQEAAKQQQQQDAAAQHPHQQPRVLEAAVLPTAQPAAAQSTGQIPQPSTATSTNPAGGNSGDTSGANNDRHDDGSYNESGSEMEGVAMSSSSSAASNGASQGGDFSSNGSGNSQAASSGAAQAGAGSAPTFEVNWNKCPQLEPSESEKNKKTQVITKCLQAAPIPTNLTRENVEAHREQIATCALKIEGWFDEQGQYKYDKAESEIRGKKLDSVIELQVLKFHVACRDEASKKFPRDQNKLIDQVQFYQACMDYYISIVCEIEVSVDQ